jgi:hypothetical protein
MSFAFILGSLLNPEDGNYTLIRKVCKHILENVALKLVGINFTFTAVKIWSLLLLGSCGHEAFYVLEYNAM